MKNTKKIVGILLAIVMVLSLSIPATAASITIQGTTTTPTAGHTYTVYQVFTGTKVTTDDGYDMLTNVKYGTNYTPGTTKVGDSVSTADLEAIEDAQAFAADIYNNRLLEGTAVATLNEANSWKAEGLADGYYMIIDATKVSDLPSGDSLSAYIVQILDDVTIAPKSTTTTVDKTVGDINDTTDDEIIWSDSADHDIGDIVPFEITATLEPNISLYKAYELTFHDTMSEGLTYNNDVKVFLGEKEITEYFNITAAPDAYGNTLLTISCDDVKQAGAEGSSQITVKYTATLNEDAIVGPTGNTNEVYAEFSNDPNSNGTGITEEDTVIVFTYKTIVNKTDADGKPLAGAEFTLYKFYKTLPEGAADYEVETSEDGISTLGYWLPLSAVVAAEGTEFSFNGLDDGDYKLVETKTPEGYNTIDPIEFTITAEHTIEGLESLTGIGENGFELTADLAAGSLETDVVNNRGTELPETGGIGTTLFTFFGAILVLGAGVLLITKKRMSVA